MGYLGGLVIVVIMGGLIVAIIGVAADLHD